MDLDYGMANSSVPTRKLSRRDFLRISAVGITGAALLGTMSTRAALAQIPSDATLIAEFQEASARYRVPLELLLSMGYVNTRWENPDPGANEYQRGDLHGWGSYGIMQLVKNPSSDTLGEASRLTGIPEETLKTDRRSNILGGAALLAESQGRRPERIGDYIGAVSGKGGNGKEYTAVAGIGAGELYANQVFETLQRGAEKTLKSGQRVTLRARGLSTAISADGEVI